MKTINPNPEKIGEVLAGIPQDKPITMLNLLKFRDKARYDDGESEKSGREAYEEYAGYALQKVQEVGGRPVWMGKAVGSLIAPETEQWDEVLLVQYPTIGAFMKMITDAEYQKIAVHRTAALEDSRLVATVAADLGS